jgi:cytochrome c
MKKALFVLLFAACQSSTPSAEQAPSDPPAAPGADGPESIKIEPLAVSTAAGDIDKGKALFASKGCNACHKADETKLVGPGLKGVTARRSTKWIQRMILSPEVMVREDPVAKQLLGTYFAPMANQGVDPKNELPPLLAYLKSIEK